MRCAVVKSNVVNVRVGPGTGYAKAPFSPVEKYYSFKVTGAKGGWIKIQDDVFNTGWVSKALLWIQ
jgi:SH3-like domain-containing protein